MGAQAPLSGARGTLAEPLPFGERDLMSPLSEARLGEVVEALAGAGPRVLDVGCGKGALLRRLAARQGITGLGIERHADLVAEARRRAQSAQLQGRLAFEVADLASFVPTEPQDLVVCMGASDALGRFPAALARLADWLRDGGLLLVDWGHWMKAPHPDYLAVLGATPDEYADAELPVRLGAAIGLAPVATWIATRGEWDAFEDDYASAHERAIAAAPDAPSAAERARWVASWREAYARWGRETLGWGLYLFRKGV